jgi:hypothetical protein
MQGKTDGTGTVVGKKQAKIFSGSRKKRKAAAEDETLPGPTPKTKRSLSTANGSSYIMHNSASSPAEAAATPELVKSKVKRGEEKASTKAAINTDERERAGPGGELQKHRARVVHTVPASEAPHLAQFKPTPRSGWWGASRFASAGESISASQSFSPPSACSARLSWALVVCSTYIMAMWWAYSGCLEGLEHTADLVAKQRQTFTEQTQEDLYLSTHAGKSSARKALGSSSAPSKPPALPGDFASPDVFEPAL